MNIPAPFSENQNAFFWRCFNSWLNVAEGGKRGGKNVLITLAYCAILEKHPSKIHLIAGVSTSTARLNILDCDGYGMLNFFEGRCRPGQYQNRDCLYVRTPTGEKIVLVSGGGKDRKVFHDLNPKAPGHWYYDILDFHERQQDVDLRYGYNYGHFTIADNMSISDDQLRRILKTYDKDSTWYKRDILGQRCIADGLVYPMFTEEKIELDAERQYRKYMISMDYGTRNPTAMILWGLCDGAWYGFKEYYFNSRVEMTQKTDQEYYDDLCKFAGGLPIDHIIIDPSALSFITLVEKKRRFKVWDADNDVLDGIRHTAQCISDGTIRICKSCENTIKEFGLYSWDEDATEDRPVKENDHAMDAVRYFVQTTGIWNKKSGRTLF